MLPLIGRAETTITDGLALLGSATDPVETMSTRLDNGESFFKAVASAMR